MNGDISRSTFRPHRHYHGVLMQQGRVQLDADWNEAGDIAAYLDETSRIDIIGRRGVPKVGGGFAIGQSPGNADLTIGSGRIYVDGLLCELDGSLGSIEMLGTDEVTVDQLILDGRPLAVGEWIEILDAAGVVAPQVSRVTAVDAASRTLQVDPAIADTTSQDSTFRRLASYTSQPDLPVPPLVSSPEGQPPELTLEDGTYLAYLDAWLRHITDLDDPALQEPALGGPDTTTRAQTLAQVRLTYLGPDPVADCAAVAPIPDLFAGSSAAGDRPPTTGRLSARARPADEATDDCEIPPDARYQGLENQLYRVEVHDPGELGTATFKWSRENGSIATLWTGQTGNRLEVASVGRDAVLGFRSGQLVELVDDTRELDGRPGTLVRLDAPPTDTELLVDPAASVQRADFPRNPKIRRWDCAEAATVEIGSADGFLALEDGIEVRFEAGHYNTGDYWLIPARTATRDVDWPRDDLDRPVPRPPAGIVHHYAPLALVDVTGGVPVAVRDCRDPFPALTAITADDVSFDNDACALPGARTVQDALDAMCEESTLRRHKKHLHGWGIVCGLRVACGPDDEEARRRHVTVGTGYAIDCDGNDLLVERDEPLDVFKLFEESGGDSSTFAERDADLSLYMDPDPEIGIKYRVEPYDDTIRPETILAGTILQRVRDECIKPIQDLLERRVDLSVCDRPDAPSSARQSLLASLFAQVINPTTSQLIYASRCEHLVMARFYADLRELLASETFCAMFDGATELPEYPDSMPAEMDTIFGMGHHQRIRLRPGGRPQEAWTLGGGLNPVKPSSFIHRYDLERRILLERLAPISGTVVGEEEPDSGSGPIADIAFSPDGRRIYVIAPTENGENTFFRSGRIEDTGVAWGELVTICDVQLVTLATTPADPDHVYAAGTGKGVYSIDPRSVDPSMAPISAFRASGHLVITAAGHVFATALKDDSTAKPPAYDRLIGFRIGAPQTEARLDIALPRAGTDDLAASERGERRAGRGPETVYVAVDGAASKQVLAYEILSEPGQAIVASDPAAIDVPDSPLQLAAFAPTDMLLVVLEDDGVVELIDMGTNKLLPNGAVPVQVGPVSVATGDKRSGALVLNYWSDTITVIPATSLRSEAFPLEDLAAYRRQTVHAFRDLLAGFLQYLKDCICDELLVACPSCTGDEKIYLASVSIRKGSVYKVCNFSRRKYVKSFPTVDYWLSAVPILPLIQRAVEEFCCMVLPDIFGKYEAPAYEPQPERRPVPRYRYSKARSGVARAQGVDIATVIGEARTKTTLTAGLIADASRRTLERRMADPAVRTGNIVGRAPDRVELDLADRGVTVNTVLDEGLELPDLLPNILGFLRTPRAGDDVTLHETAGRVSYYTVSTPTSREPGAEGQLDKGALAELASLRAQVRKLEAGREAAAVHAERVAALEAEVQAMRGLREQLAQLVDADKPRVAGRKPAAAPKATAPKPSTSTTKRKPPQRRP